MVGEVEIRPAGAEEDLAAGGGVDFGAGLLVTRVEPEGDVLPGKADYRVNQFS